MLVILATRIRQFISLILKLGAVILDSEVFRPAMAILLAPLGSREPDRRLHPPAEPADLAAPPRSPQVKGLPKCAETETKSPSSGFADDRRGRRQPRNALTCEHALAKLEPKLR